MLHKTNTISTRPFPMKGARSCTHGSLIYNKIGIEMAASKSKILVIGATGHIGKFIVAASAKAGHPTYALVRKETPANEAKASIIDNFKNLGVNLVLGDVHDHDSLVKAITQVDVVISTVTTSMAADQVKIIDAIKEAGNVKRFFPSEFGMDGDRTRAMEPVRSLMFAPKIQIRRTVEAAGIPYTYVSANNYDGYFLVDMSQELGATSPPRDKVVILGDGNVKAVYNYEGDIATYTIRAVDDPRTINKILYIRPPSNMHTFNEVISLWEKKLGKILEKVYISEEEILKNIQVSPLMVSAFYAMRHAIHVLGDETYFEIEPSFGVEASALYPDVICTSVDEYLDRLV